MTRQSIETKSIGLMYVGSLDGQPLGNIVVPFRCFGPGPRVMATIKLLVLQRFGPSPFDWTQFASLTWSLWLYRSIITDDGQRVPVQNLFGTRANPVRLDNGTTVDSVNGASVDCTCGGDGIDGELTLGVLATSGQANPILPQLRVRYNAVAPLCDDEWARILAGAGTSPDARPIKFGTSLG